MAQKAITPNGDSYCSSCGSKVVDDDAICPKCSQELIDVVDAGLCGQCQNVVTIDAVKCNKCGSEFEPVKTDSGFSEAQFLRRMLQWQNLPGQKGTMPPTSGQIQMRPFGEGHPVPRPDILDRYESSIPLWQLAEPLDKVLRYRKGRMENVDALINEAKKRMEELDRINDPKQRGERIKLKRWIDEILTERDDLFTIEAGMMEIDKTYRNLLAVQQTELQNKQTSIRHRLDEFQKELKHFEKEKSVVREREEEVERKEDEIRKILGKIEEKEHELEGLEDKLKNKSREAEEQKKRLFEVEQQVEKDKWMAAQKELQSQVIALRSKDIVVEAGPKDLGEFPVKIANLEEQIERLSEEKGRIQKRAKERDVLLQDIKKLLELLDELLGDLPPEVIKRFANSKDFTLYESVLKKCGV